jgi:hypothetical protein
MVKFTREERMILQAAQSNKDGRIAPSERHRTTLNCLVMMGFMSNDGLHYTITKVGRLEKIEE